MPAYARREKMNPWAVEPHHVWSRCVGGAYLHGYDQATGRDFSHRRQWMASLSEYLASVFAVEVGGENFLANHYHGIYRNRPDIAKSWSDEEVCWRWKLAWPQFIDGRWLREPTDEAINAMLMRGQENPDYLEQIRSNLANISWFQARLKQKIAWLVNRDAPKSQQKRGHHWEARYGNRRLESDDEVLVAFLYNDLQQVAAGAAESLEASNFSSIQRQIQAQAQETFQRVHRRRPTDRDEDLKEIEQITALYANCSLAPISSDGPLLTTLETTTPKSELVLPAGYYFEQQLADRELQSPAATQDGCEDESFTEPNECNLGPEQPTPGKMDSEAKASHRGTEAPSRRRSDVSRRNTSIHHRLRKQQRRRASRCSILNISWEKYYELLKRAERAHLDSRQGSPMAEPAEIGEFLQGGIQSQHPAIHCGLPERAPLEDQPGSADRMETSATWRHHVKQFTEWLRSIAGEFPEDLAAHLMPKSRGDPQSPNK